MRRRDPGSEDDTDGEGCFKFEQKEITLTKLPTLCDGIGCGRASSICRCQKGRTDDAYFASLDNLRLHRETSSVSGRCIGDFCTGLLHRR